MVEQGTPLHNPESAEESFEVPELEQAPTKRRLTNKREQKRDLVLNISALKAKIEND